LDEFGTADAALPPEGVTQKLPVDFVVGQEQVGSGEGVVGWGRKGFYDAVVFWVSKLVH
jgi:hypothetical protein